MRRIELKNGHFVDINAGQAYPLSTRLLIEDELISALSFAESSSDEGVDESVDLGGRWVIPGLFNTHAHVGLPIPASIMSLKDARKPKQHDFDLDAVPVILRNMNVTGG